MTIIHIRTTTSVVPVPQMNQSTHLVSLNITIPNHQESDTKLHHRLSIKSINFYLTFIVAHHIYPHKLDITSADAPTCDSLLLWRCRARIQFVRTFVQVSIFHLNTQLTYRTHWVKVIYLSILNHFKIDFLLFLN